MKVSGQEANRNGKCQKKKVKKNTPQGSHFVTRSAMEVKALNVLSVVVRNFLGNIKADNYQKIV